MKAILKATALIGLLLTAGCAETAAMLDATAVQLCRENPSQDCYDNGYL